MPPPTTKTLSPAELAQLEHAFATDPTSQAYKPLAEAYLSMGRFMEAMVVCKKGVKAHPTQADPRVLLARVYAEQGKDKKALEELNSALQVSPTDKSALRQLASIQLKSGESDGKANLLKAFEADPKDEETLSLMQKHGVPLPQAAAPAPPPPPQPAAPQVVAHTGGNGAAAHQVQQVAPAQPQHAQGPTPSAPPQPRVSRPQARPAAPQQPRRPQARRAYDDEEDSVSESYEVPRRKKKSGSSKLVFILLVIALPLGLAGYGIKGRIDAVNKREANKLMREADELLKNDTFDSYKKAIEKCEAALDVVPDSPEAHAKLAYAYAIRWGEHERDDVNRQRVEEHLSAAKAEGDKSSYRYAAEALLQFYQGKGQEAANKLAEVVRTEEEQDRKSSLLYLTLGILQMNEGFLEPAKENLEKAQAIKSDDPRVYVALGNLSRRRGNDMSALSQYNSALKFTRNSHPEGLLGTALLILDQENPSAGYVNAAKYLKTLIDADPPPSPRQLAMAHFVKALLISRVSTDIPLYTDEGFKKTLTEGTGITADKDKAKADIKKEEQEGTNLDRNNPELLLIRGKRLFWEENLDGAIAELRKAVDAEPTNSKYQVELAKVLMRKEGGDKQAEDVLRKALALVPNSPKLMTMLGQVLLKQNRKDEARAEFEKVIETSDKKTRNPEARLMLGRLYVEKKELEKASEQLKKAGEEYYSDPTMASTAFDELGQVWELRKNKEEAKIAYEKALNGDQDYAAPYCHYAKLLAAMNDKDKGKPLAEKFVKAMPNDACTAELRTLYGG